MELSKYPLVKNIEKPKTIIVYRTVEHHNCVTFIQTEKY